MTAPVHPFLRAIVADTANERAHWQRVEQIDAERAFIAEALAAFRAMDSEDRADLMDELGRVGK